MTLGVVLAVVPLVGGCSGDEIISWTEEVKLLDGGADIAANDARYEGERRVA
jgi:hypothetical protein